MYQLTEVEVERYQSLMITLTECAKRDDKHATVCAGLYAKMFSYPFVVDVVVLNKVRCLLQALSQILQSSTINWYQAAVDIRLTLPL